MSLNLLGFTAPEDSERSLLSIPRVATVHDDFKNSKSRIIDPEVGCEAVRDTVHFDLEATAVLQARPG